MTGIKQLDWKKIFNNYTLTVIIPIILFWLILFLLGYPKPIPDDLYFIGAAINIVKNGEFYNPLLREWATQTTDRFFVQPPFYSWVLAGWLFVFRVNTTSLLFFQFLCYITFSISTVLILKKYNFPKITSFLIIGLYTTWIINSGLRMDALAMALLTLGLWFLTKDTNIRYLLGFFFLGASVLTSLIMLAYVIPFGLIILIDNFLKQKILWQKYLLQKGLILLSTIFVLIILFLIAINGELARFMADLSWHSSLRREETIFSIVNIPSLSRKLFVFPLWFVMLSSFIFVLISNKIKYQDKLISITFFSAVLLNLLIYVNSVSLFYQFNYFCWLLLIITNNAIFKIISQWQKIILIIITILIFSANQSWNIIQLISSENVNNSKYEMIKQQVNEIPDNKILAVDDVSARYIFDYHLRDNSVDWNWHKVGINEKSQDKVLIISPKKALWVKGLPDFEKAELFGHKFNTIPKYPYDIMIIK